MAYWYLSKHNGSLLKNHLVEMPQVPPETHADEVVYTYTQIFKVRQELGTYRYKAPQRYASAQVHIKNKVRTLTYPIRGNGIYPRLIFRLYSVAGRAQNGVYAVINPSYPCIDKSP